MRGGTYLLAIELLPKRAPNHNHEDFIRKAYLVANPIELVSLYDQKHCRTIVFLEL